jgi:hypothetical protein
MADRFTRFLRLERPHQPGDQHTPVANAERFTPEEPRPPGSGIEIDEEPAGEQPFLRCAQCEMDNARFAEQCSNCGAPLRTPEQDLYNRQLWQKRRKEAEAESEALKRMHAPPPPPASANPEAVRQRLGEMDPRHALGETLARQVYEREKNKLFWMTGMTSYNAVPLGVRIVRAMPARWRWWGGAGLLCWLAGTGSVALRSHNPTAMWLFFGTLILLLLSFSPARPRRRYWWSPNDWW